MKQKRTLSLLILIVSISAIGIYSWTQRETLMSMTSIRWPYLFFLFIVQTWVYMIQGLQTKTYMNIFNINMRFREWFGLSMVTAMTNIITPLQGGMFLRAGYLKKKHSLSYPVFASVQMSSYVLFFMATSILGLILVLLVYLKHEIFSPVISLFFASVITGTAALLKFSPTISPSDSKFKKAIRNMLEGWSQIKGNFRLIVQILLIMFMSSAAYGLLMYLGYRALSLRPGLLVVLLLAVTSSYTAIIKLTPGNLGIDEALVAIISQLMEIGFHQGLLVAILLRAISIAVIFIFGPIFTFILTKELTGTPEQGET